MKRATKQRLSLAAIMVLLLSGCGSVGKETKKQEQQVLRVGIDSELSTADVSLAMDNTAADVMSQVGEGQSQPMILNILGSAQWTQKQLPRKRIILKG